VETGVDCGAEPNVQQDAQSEDEEEAQAAAIFALDVLAHSLVSSWERTASVCIIHLFLFLPPPPTFSSCIQFLRNIFFLSSEYFHMSEWYNRT